jgi:hypothetical protein
MRNQQSYTIFDGTGVQSQAFTMNTTATVTSNAHGLSNEDTVVLTTATTLPDPLELLTVYYVKSVTTNTFELSATQGGASITSTDAGTGAHTYHLQGRNIYVGDSRNVILSIDTDGGGDAAGTAKIVGSMSEDCPNFAGAQLGSNQWDTVETINLADGNSVAGDTGFVVAGADDHVQYEVNVNALKWITVVISGYSAGEFTIKALLADNQ